MGLGAVCEGLVVEGAAHDGGGGVLAHRDACDDAGEGGGAEGGSLRSS